MPSKNVPEELWEKMDDSVAKVEAQGHDKESAVAICYASIVEGKAIDLAIEEQHLGALKTGARNSAEEKRRVREIRKHAGEINNLTKELEPNDDDETTMDRITGKANLETEGTYNWERHDAVRSVW